MRSGPVTSLHKCALLLPGTLDKNLPAARDQAADVPQMRHQGRSYAAAIETLERAGLVVRRDGMDSYVAEREKWEPLVNRVATTLGFGMDATDRRRLQDRAAR